jgi:hypothetical protein
MTMYLIGFLIGAIHHEDYVLYLQDTLNHFAKHKGFKRPEQFTFNNVDELVASVSKWKNKEGVVLYTNRGQVIHKIKSDDYKKKHAFKSNATLENTLELFINFGKPDFNTFIAKIGELYDWECVEMVRGYASNICDAHVEVKKIIFGFDVFVKEILLPLPTRKEQAEKVFSSYGKTNRASFVFVRLERKELDDRQILKLFWQVLKK